MRTRAKLLVLGTALAILALTIGSGGPSGRTISVCPVGCAFGSIQAAIDAAQPGDTVVVGAGTYRENLTITKGLALKGAGRDVTTIVGTVSIATADEVQFTGFALTGGRGLTIRDSSGITIANNAITASRGAGLLLSDAGATVERNTIRGNATQGVLIAFNSDVVLRDNTIHDNGGDGVAVEGSRAVLERNTVKGNSGCGVRTDGGSRVEGRDNMTARNKETLCGVSAAVLEKEPPPPPGNLRVTPPGWTNARITVDWETPDDPSEVVAFWYKVGAAPTGATDGTRVPIGQKPLMLTAPPEGEKPVFVWLEDSVGNASHLRRSQATFFFDKTPPTIRAVLSKEPNPNGWHSEDVTVTFVCDDGPSGIGSCTPDRPVVVTEEVKGRAIRGEAVDRAGNRTPAQVTINLDKTPPTLEPGAPQGTLGIEGWYRSDVAVTFTARDNLSGFAGAGLTTQVTGRTSGEGEARRIAVRVTDLAGHTVEAQAGPFRVDTTPPTARIVLSPASPDGRDGWFATPVAVRYECADALSGLDPAAPCPSDATLIADGTHALRLDVRDKAGNPATDSRTVKLDTAPPSGTLTINAGAATTGSFIVTLTVSAADATSGVAEMRFSNDGSTWSDWEPFKTTRTDWDLTRFGGSRGEGTKTVHGQVRDRAGNVSVGFTASIRYAVPPPPPGWVLIPAGSFRMGDSFGEGRSDERPVHTVHVSAFYMDRYEVTKALWDEVAAWAQANGYDLKPADGSGKAPNHPVVHVTWYEAVKWANARSEREGLTPAYYTSAAKTTVYRTGILNIQNDWVRWDSGYRLPTEAEWEKAARGGCEGRRFPWCDTDTIQHARANYRSDAYYSYDTSPTRGYHPTYKAGSEPYTSPVGSFAPNGYGLYDMAGNVWEWCWDWYSDTYYATSPGTDPRGPGSGSNRGERGGSWGNYAFYCRAAYRNYYGPGRDNSFLGFRLVRTAP